MACDNVYNLQFSYQQSFASGILIAKLVKKHPKHKFYEKENSQSI